MTRDHIATACVCCASVGLRSTPAILMPFVAHRALGWEPVEIDASWGLQTIAQGRAYTVCRSLECQECGLLFLDIRFSEREMAALYADYRGPAYTAMRDRYEPGYAARNAGFVASVAYLPEIEAFLRPWCPAPQTILDWGGDTGINTPFRSAARTVHVCEISNKPMLPGVDRVMPDQIGQLAYDLVVCSNVLEHVPYPDDVIAALRPALRADTILYIEVPFENLMRVAAPGESLCARKRHWHEHINFFTPRALRSLLGRHGLEILADQVLPVVGGGSAAAVLQCAVRLSGVPSSQSNG